MSRVSEQKHEQFGDSIFDARVERPAYRADGPTVFFDEAHHNFHTAGGRYKPFADLLIGDGFRVVPGRQEFSNETFAGCRVLVISNALGASDIAAPGAANPAFTAPECDRVGEWVHAGGSLLLITDHAPTGAASADLAQRFGVDMSKGSTIDPSHHDQETGNLGFIVYTRDSGGVMDHAVTRGRGDEERINRVMTFTGQSLRGPAGSVAFLKLADTARDLSPSTEGQGVSAAGRAQGVAMVFGEGRVVVLGEAGMLTAQVTGPRRLRFGMSRHGVDNRQLALNIMHWLSGLID
jgi:hypothetical protein